MRLFYTTKNKEYVIQLWRIFCPNIMLSIRVYNVILLKSSIKVLYIPNKIVINVRSNFSCQHVRMFNIIKKNKLRTF